MTTTSFDVLDNPGWTSLTGPHAHLAERRGSAVRYPAEVSPFSGLADPDDPAAWEDLAVLLGRGEPAVLIGVSQVPDGWTVHGGGEGVQLVDVSVDASVDPEAIRLGPEDVPEMLDLVARTKPGPFLTRTIEMGSYVGIRSDGGLVALAGERLHPTGWTEISAVCTDQEHQGKGLASRLVRTVAAGIRERGETPFLHAASTNTNAIRLYESMGFELRKRVSFLFVSPG